jgi:hypothetical protein
MWFGKKPKRPSYKSKNLKERIRLRDLVSDIEELWSKPGNAGTFDDALRAPHGATRFMEMVTLLIEEDQRSALDGLVKMYFFELSVDQQVDVVTQLLMLIESE